MKIGDKCFVSGYIDEIRKNTVIVRNSGGYFGTSPGEVITVYNTAHPNWIPCSEKLPEDDTLMLVNYVDHRPDAMDIWIGWHEMENVWYIDGEAHSEEFGNEVVAWMPLPEPYREGGEKK